MNKSKSSNQTTNNSMPITLQDVEGLSIVGNSGAVSVTDGGAIKGALDLAGLNVETSAALTMALVDRQAQAGQAALESAKEAATLGYQFAMDAGRSDVSAVMDSNKILIIVAAIAGAVVVFRGWKA